MTENESEQMRKVRDYSDNTTTITCLKSRIGRIALELSGLVAGDFDGLGQRMKEEDPQRFDMMADLGALALALAQREALEKIMMNMGLGALIKDA